MTKRFELFGLTAKVLRKSVWMLRIATVFAVLISLYAYRMPSKYGLKKSQNKVDVTNYLVALQSESTDHGIEWVKNPTLKSSSDKASKARQKLPPPYEDILDVNIERGAIVFDVSVGRELGFEIVQGKATAEVGEVFIFYSYV